MSSSGFVYALINPSMQGLVKVGRTGRNPKSRAAELSGATGVPTPFIVVYHEHFEDCEWAETAVHTLLESQGYRISDAREFFDADVVDVIKAIVACPGKSEPPIIGGEGSVPGEETFSSDISSQIASLMRRAENLEYGTDGEFEDFAEALSLYKRAADLGSAEALSKLGEFYEFGRGVRADADAALDFYKRAVGKGWTAAYSNMANIFVGANHERNFRTAWANFVQAAEGADPLIGWKYFAQHGARNWRIDDVPQIFVARRDDIRKLAEMLVNNNRGEPNLKFVQSLIVAALFPEEETGGVGLEYDDAVEIMKCRRVSANIYRLPSGYDIQIISGKWYVDRLGMSGDTPEELIAAFSDR